MSIRHERFVEYSAVPKNSAVQKASKTQLQARQCSSLIVSTPARTQLLQHVHACHVVTVVPPGSIGAAPAEAALADGLEAGAGTAPGKSAASTVSESPAAAAAARTQPSVSLNRWWRCHADCACLLTFCLRRLLRCRVACSFEGRRTDVAEHVLQRRPNAAHDGEGAAVARLRRLPLVHHDQRRPCTRRSSELSRVTSNPDMWSGWHEATVASCIRRTCRQSRRSGAQDASRRAASYDPHPQ